MQKYLQLLPLFLLVFASMLHAQDPYFSQFAANPHQVNPAQIGVHDGLFRASVSYREQWNTVLGTEPFRTMSASADMRRPVLKYDFVTVGFSVLHDQVGVSSFAQDRAHVAVSYMKRIGGKGFRSAAQYLIAGGQFGYGVNNFDEPDLWFTQQFDAEIQDVLFGRPTGEELNFANMTAPSFVDANAGLMWYTSFEENRSVYVGGSVQHITSPNVSFFEDGDLQLARRYVAQIGGEFPMNNRGNVTLMPQALGLLQGQAMNVFGGTHLRYTSRDWKEVALRMGLFGHVANRLESGVLLQSLIVSATLETERMNFGLSYDINTSSLSQVTNARGAFELSVVYKQPSKGGRYRVDCPRF